MPKLLSDLITALPAPQVLSINGGLGIPITAPVVEQDSDVQPGGVFVARPGRIVDGHDFIGRAIERGAAAVVGERDMTGLSVPYIRVRDAQAATGYLAAAYHDFPSRKLVIIGVTGTDGKTTTSALIHSILKHAAQGRAGLISTVMADLGGETADTGLHVTTPSAPQIQAFLAQMVERGLQYAVIEMTSHGLVQGRLNGIDVDVAVLTNLTHEHLDFHGTFENYRSAKGLLWGMLNHAYRKTLNRVAIPKISVVNADDPNADYFAMFNADQVILYGVGENALYRAIDIQFTAQGTLFQVEYPDEQALGTTVSSEHFISPLLGEFNVYNALAAIQVCIALPIPTLLVREGLSQAAPIPGRMEKIDVGQPYLALVDFAHTPNALKQVLTTCRGMLNPGGRLIAIFGSAGLRDREKRVLMAEVGAQLADVVILTAEDPRTESLEDILATMHKAAKDQRSGSDKNIFRIPDRGMALAAACQMARAEDIVIACGKGHEQSMCFGTVEYPWDDREALRAAIEGHPIDTLPTAGA